MKDTADESDHNIDRCCIALYGVGSGSHQSVLTPGQTPAGCLPGMDDGAVESVSWRQKPETVMGG